MIPESFIQELLNRIDVVDVIDKRITLKKAGANYSACCPFHQEKTPSFTVSPSKQFYHCFGCGAHGSAISFLIEYEGLTFIEAITELANSIGLKVPNDAPQKIKKENEYSNLEEVIKIANIFYQKQLRKSPKAISYLKSRGLTGEIAKEFEIGYAPEGWQNLKTVFKKYEDESLVKAGLIVKNEKGKVYDRFRNRIIFPIYNDKGKVIGFGGRIIDPEDTPKYYNSPETILFQKSYELYGLLASRKAIRQKEYVLVVEGYMDVVGLAQKGIKNVVATLNMFFGIGALFSVLLLVYIDLINFREVMRCLFLAPAIITGIMLGRHNIVKSYVNKNLKKIVLIVCFVSALIVLGQAFI